MRKIIVAILICYLSSFLRAEVNQVVICAVGDMRFNGYIGDKIQEKGNEYPFHLVKDVLANADIAYGNLECPIASSGTFIAGKEYTFRAEPFTITALTAAGFDIVDLANNHSGDCGPEGLLSTMAILDQQGIRHVGAGNNIDEARMPALLKRNGLTIAFCSFTNTFPDTFWAKEHTPGVTPAYLEYITHDVKKAAAVSDIVIACYHGGDERSSIPKQSQKDIAHTAINAGASMVFGHHPHVLQGIEIYKGKPICYSLGNFMFLSKEKQCYDTMIVRVVVEKDNIISFEIIPIRIADAYVRPAQGEDKKRILETLQTLSQSLGTQLKITGDKAVIEIP